jgi:hypothetical protein
VNREQISAAKKAVRERNRRLRAEERADAWEQVKCFWTWPIGHAYRNGNCVGCDKSYPTNY